MYMCVRVYEILQNKKRHIIARYVWNYEFSVNGHTPRHIFVAHQPSLRHPYIFRWMLSAYCFDIELIVHVINTIMSRLSPPRLLNCIRQDHLNQQLYAIIRW